jgi:hypothetical protein
MNQPILNLASIIVKALNDLDERLNAEVPKIHPLRLKIHEMLAELERLIDTQSLELIDILDEAKALTSGNRQADYGKATESFERIASFWRIYLGNGITGKDVAMMMLLLKISRSLTSDKRDTFVDMAGYVQLGYIVNEYDRTPF